MRSVSQTPERSVAQDGRMMRRLPFMLALLAVQLGGCSGESHDQAEHRTPMPSTLAGVYAGDFPCSNCERIEATLWLRADGAFVLRQRLVDGPGAPSVAAGGPSTTFGLGRWSWDEAAAEAVL